MKYQAKNVEAKRVKGWLDELAQRCGSLESAALYADIGTTTAYRIARNYHKTVQISTADRILKGLYKRRREDRRNGGNPQYALQRRKKIMKEARLDRNADNVKGGVWS